MKIIEKIQNNKNLYRIKKYKNTPYLKIYFTPKTFITFGKVEAISFITKKLTRK